LSLQVDIYSMAMNFWYIFCGTRPFDSTDPRLIATLASTRGLRPDARAVAWPPLESLIEQMWSHDRALRPAAPEILRCLAEINPDRDARAPRPIACTTSCQCAIM